MIISPPSLVCLRLLSSQSLPFGPQSLDPVEIHCLPAAGDARLSSKLDGNQGKAPLAQRSAFVCSSSSLLLTVRPSSPLIAAPDGQN